MELVSLKNRKKLELPLGFSGWSDDKESVCNAGDPGLTPGWENPLEKEMATHSQYSIMYSLQQEDSHLQVRKRTLTRH